ncbi:hypothetical protein EVAR_36313_1 [Eumeta japonica]|uniref:Uncharacterized protein n=1 Tax=Eumeta variegata TaxID=151549 RepID=A0A4C1VIL8_EUMVA|nr:hypothetical protein EVAR_36313_1 [Eumeta japonica]
MERHAIQEICLVSRHERASKEGVTSDVRERCDLKENIVTTVEKGVLRRFGQLERLNEIRLDNANLFELMCVMKRRAERQPNDGIDPGQSSVSPRVSHRGRPAPALSRPEVVHLTSRPPRHR